MKKKENEIKLKKKKKVSFKKNKKLDDIDSMCDIDDINDFIPMEKLFMQEVPNKENSLSCSDDSGNLEENEKNLLKKNNMVTERLITIDKILDMYPSLKKDRDVIISNILDKNRQMSERSIFEKIVIDKKNYYFEQSGIILDADTNLVGIFFKKNNYYEYSLFFEEN